MSTPVNMGAVEAMGGQFNKNAFAAGREYFGKKFHQSRRNDIQVHKDQQRQAQKNLKQTQQAAKQHAAAQQKAAKQFGQAQAKAASTARKTAQGAQKAYTQGVKAGRVAPGAGAPPRTFAMAPSPQQKAQQKQQATFQQQQFKNMQSQVNAAHGMALKEQAQRQKTMQSQVNFAHGEAIKEAARRAKVGNTPSAPAATPAGKTVLARNPAKPEYSSGTNIPTPPPKATNPGGKAAPVGPQFADTTPKSNAPFPTHVHPEGSSSQILPNLTANQPAPNQFTVGSRNIKGGGIAAMGSQLEAGLSSRKFPLPEPRKRV